ncbi:MAG: hypothetical protein AB8G05_14415 [Oligoflexales bacterium]
MKSGILKSIILFFIAASSQNILCQKTSGLSLFLAKPDTSLRNLELQQALHLLSKYKELAINSPTFTQQRLDQDFILKFFKTLWGNKKVNKKLRSSQNFKANINSSKLDPQVISHLITYTYKTQKSYDEISIKIKNISEKLVTNSPIHPVEQMKVRELRKLISMVHLHILFQDFEKWGFLKILSTDPKIANLKNKAEAAYDLHRKLLAHAHEFQPKKGVYLVAYDFRNDFAYRNAGAGHILTLEALAYILNLRVSHFSLAFSWNDIKYESHMWGKPSKYKVGTMPLVSYVYDTYYLKLEKLIPVPSLMTKQFKDLYGETWLESIEERFEEIMKKYFIDNKNQNFSRLYNPEVRRIKSIFALDYSITKTRQEDQIYFSHTGKVTCSEFIAKALLQCIELLNQKIAMEWQNYRYKGELPSPYLKFPIKKARKIKRYSPQEYFDHLIEYDLIEKLKTPPLLAKTIKIK